MKIRKKPLIKTERLVLKPYEQQDRYRLSEMFQNEEITRTFMVPLYATEEEYLELADKLIRFSQVEDEKHLEYGIYRNGYPIGFVNDCGYDEEEIEIGYVINPAFQNHGYATEAVLAVMEELWEMGFQKIKSGFFEENTASFRVMEKCGMTLTGEEEEDDYRGEKRRCLICSIRRTSG